MALIPDDCGELFEQKAFAHLATSLGEDRDPCRRPGDVRVVCTILPGRGQGLSGR